MGHIRIRPWGPDCRRYCMAGLSFFEGDDEDDEEVWWWKSFVSFDEPEPRDKLSSSLETLWFENITINTRRTGCLNDGWVDGATDWLFCLICQLMVGLTDWLAGRLTDDWLTVLSDMTDWLFCLICQLMVGLTDWLWLTDDWLTDSLSGWLTDWLADWLTDWLND